jgi:hypothetical protein
MRALVSVDRSFGPICAVAVVTCVVSLSGCGNPQAPEVENLESLVLALPDSVAAGAPFSIEVQAVGDQGTRPLTSFSGAVTLSVSAGSITPAALTLVNGSGAATVSVGPDEGAITIEASSGGVLATASLRVGPTQILAGAPSDPAVEAIPDVRFVADPSEYMTDHPDLPGLSVSYRTVLLTIDAAATVGDVNELLMGRAAAVAGGIPGAANRTAGLLILRLPFTSHAEMDALLDDLAASDAVVVATPDNLQEVPALPAPGGAPFDWIWDGELEADGNWGLEVSRVPQMWNLNAAVASLGDRVVDLGVIDNGFYTHPDVDLASNFSPDQRETHGSHVVGIMGAGFDNGLGIDGVTPFARLHVAGDSLLSMAALYDGMHQVVVAGARVVNLSLATKWKTVHPDDAPGRLALVRDQSLQFEVFHGTISPPGRPVLFVSGSGNDSEWHSKIVPAHQASPWNMAALEFGFDHVIVVEAVDLDETAGTNTVRPAFSGPGGHVSAPGVSILSTVADSDYEYRSGTSMAAPFVTGLIGYLLSVDPTLSNAEIKDILIHSGAPVDPGEGIESSDRVDAFSAVLDIDRVRQNDHVLRMLLDIDDGTVDGNLRVDPENPGVDYLESDADGDGSIGDGSIDMSDFRRWRDLYLEYADAAGARLDGSVDHPKRDLNANGLVASDPDEYLYPSADFNGDGTLSPSDGVDMSGYLDGMGPRTDLEVLQALFSDPDYTADELDELVESGDFHVQMEAWLQDFPSADRLESEIGTTLEDGSFIQQGIRAHEVDPLQIYTMISSEVPSRLRAWALNPAGDTLCVVSTDLAVGTGEDVYWAPRCGAEVSVEISLASRVEPGTPSPLLVRAGVKRGELPFRYEAGLDIDLLVTGGSAGMTGGVTDGDGYVQTVATLGTSAAELRVFATATDPVSGASATAQAVALPLVNTGRVVVVENLSFVRADASAAFTCSEGTETRTPESQDLDFSIAHSCSGTAQGEAHSSEVSLVGTITFDVDSQTQELSGASLSATGSGGDSATGIASSSFATWLVMTFDVVGGPVFLTASGTAQTSHLENDGGGGSGLFRLVRGGDFATSLYRVQDRGPGYSIELDEAMTLEPGRYQIDARLEGNRGSSSIDFVFRIGPQP